ncbi:TonB-dependent siderophore receptor [Lentimicrobium sp. S6]|uniref:TonB-dependent receptor n=1 Tax=Lentimicrobium sp. S6 TaxID=2735872 RepID=UPI001556CC19|nr:TonB-dependent receptor [Lentimicrobium sp. S6]NPD46258.1 TonB-dependent receptor [Lentimicrobium sp. S6]
MKKFTFLFMFLNLVFALNIYAQTTVTGTVTDEDGLSIPSVSVIVKNTLNGTISDMDGNFSLNVEKFPVTLVASFVGYESVEVDVTSTVPVKVILASGVGLEEVTITGSMTVRTENEAAMSMTSMKAKEIQMKAASGQADILRSIPGITAEGGGGEVATNVFVRGLPSGGQYVFNPLQYDGMPTISTFGLNSSAHDVYVRNDFGIRMLDFPRGGAAILYGAGSVAGLINYISKTGTETPENIIQFEAADQGRMKADFYSGGKLGGEGSKTYYALSGFYRYDEGPIKTGLPTQGFQLRGNVKQLFDHGSLVLSGQYIDDRVQFFLPLPLDGDSREFATGNDGEEVNTIQTVHASNISYQTPNGVYHTPIKDGVSTKGGYFMADYKQEFSSGLRLNTKLRYARYQHQFNLFLAGSGNPQSLTDFVTAIDPEATNIVGTNTGTTRTMPNSDKVLVNTLLDRNRPMTDLAGEMNLTQKWVTGELEHHVTLGGFFSRSEAEDQNIQSRYVSEFNSIPQLVDITYTSGGNDMVLSQNGVFNPGAAYANNFITANKMAGYLTDEMQIGRWRIDVGLRVEKISADVTREGNTTYQMSEDESLSSELQTVSWGNNAYLTGNGQDTDWAGVLAANYQLNENVNLYGNLTKGYFFPQPRGIQVSSDGTVGSYETEKIYQGEIGAKYANKKIKATIAGYYVDLNDRRDVRLIDDPNNPGTIIEDVSTKSTRSIGVEATWDYEFVKYLHFSGSLTYQNHEYDEHKSTPEYVGNKLARQPNFLSNLALDYFGEKFDAGVSMSHTGKKFTDDSNNVELDAINIFRLDAGYTMRLGDNGETLRLGAAVFNLTDSKGPTEGNPRDLSQSNSGVYFVGRPILPRRLFIRATFTF